MKTQFSIIKNLIIMCFFCSCSKQPTACFETETSNPVADSVTTFKNCSSFGRGHAEWDFGDGSPILDNPMPNIEHVFSDSGKYTITLKVISGNKSDMLSKEIYVRK